MIEIQDKTGCCSCSACVQRCPKQCISLHEDSEGFLYPEADRNICIDCGLCEKVCPVIHQSAEREPLEVFAAKNPDEKVRRESSSGGVFTMLAERIIDEGGIVFGACFDERWEVVHQSAETKTDLAKFRGSKYVQSKVQDTFKAAESQLKAGRRVLYSGTPCQIAGLNLFLRKDYENLLAVDFICHGVPSPGVFRTYLQEELNKNALQGVGKNTVLLPCIPLISERDGLSCGDFHIQSISFRDKRNGWKKFGFALVLSKASAAGEGNSVSLSYTPLDKNLFLRGFLHDLYLRPSCYACPFKCLKSGSDITLGDWWGIDSLMPEIDDDRGVSVVTVNTGKGRAIIEKVGAPLYSLPYEELMKRNPALVKSAAIPDKRLVFFENDGKTFEAKIRKLAKAKFSLRRAAYGLIYKLTPIGLRNMIKQIIKRICQSTLPA